MKQNTRTRIERLERQAPPAAIDVADAPAPTPLTMAQVWQILCDNTRLYMDGWGGRLAIKPGLIHTAWVQEKRAFLEYEIACIQEQMDAGYLPPIFLTSAEAETALAMLDAGGIKQCHDPKSGAADDPPTWPEVGFQWHHYVHVANDPNARHLFLSLTDYTRYDEEQRRQSRTLDAVQAAIDLWDALTMHQVFPPGYFLAADDLRAFLVMALDEARGFESLEREAEP